MRRTVGRYTNHHRQIPEVELKAAEDSAVDQYNAEKAGNSGYASLGEEVVRWQACSEDPIGK